MTTVIGINENLDMYVDNTQNIAIFSGQTSNAAGLTAVAQACQTATLAQLGEMLFFTQNGMPSLSTVFVGNPNYSLYSAAVVAAITAINNVNSVDEITISSNNGTMNYTALISTTYGSVTISG